MRNVALDIYCHSYDELVIFAIFLSFNGFRGNVVRMCKNAVAMSSYFTNKPTPSALSYRQLVAYNGSFFQIDTDGTLYNHFIQ